ncbi:hypothetical protein H0H81_000792 [Sphagnurus paluster]|uniref:Uncharacterized protein n=1 Tax=Sphagnurus paluster TaxID=117069 RepID=A0A9P7K4E8_9AGAR|nr:hypothetical protein H0H81_000792 [Sphagnurus paluster]
MRPLTLHASALNDEEYDLYTASLNDLAEDDGADGEGHGHDDAYYEQMQIGVREARGWIRGRYSHLPAGSIDSILRFFSPGLSPADVLTGGQFFAVLRLVVHVESGKDVDRGLAFVQAHPSQAASPRRPSLDSAGPAPPTPASIARAFENRSAAGEKETDRGREAASAPAVPRRDSVAPPTPASIARTFAHGTSKHAEELFSQGTWFGPWRDAF